MRSLVRLGAAVDEALSSHTSPSVDDDIRFELYGRGLNLPGASIVCAMVGVVEGISWSTDKLIQGGGMFNGNDGERVGPGNVAGPAPSEWDFLNDG